MQKPLLGYLNEFGSEITV